MSEEERQGSAVKADFEWRPPVPVPAERATRYRVQGLWDGRCLADGIEAASAGRSDALAVVDNERRLTYPELERAVGGAVSTLRRADLGAGATAVLIGGNTIDTVVAYHALLRIGAMFAVLDRRCGSADVHHAVDAFAANPLVVVPSAERERLTGEVTSVVVELERVGRASATAGDTAWSEPDRDGPAVVLFTSGTTSRPKGVVHSLNTITAAAANMATITGADERSVLFLVSPATSITGVMQMHLAADQHATLVLEDRFDPEVSLEWINGVGATLLGGAPVIVERLLRATGLQERPHIALQTLALGGAMLPRPLLEVATDDFGIEIARVYGSSEAPNFTGSVPSDDRERRLSDDGALLAGSEVRVGSAAHPQEGLLRGPGVFLGYIDAEDNASAFEGEWYKTGDLVEVSEGRLTVIGRLKEVVNRNGLKISLSEIDAALSGLPGVVEAAAFGLPDALTGERLVVAIEAERGSEVVLGDVVAYLLGQGLAKRKLPEELIVWDGPLPRTASGKVVRSRLVMEAPPKRHGTI